MVRQPREQGFNVGHGRFALGLELVQAEFSRLGDGYCCVVNLFTDDFKLWIFLVCHRWPPLGLQFQFRSRDISVRTFAATFSARPATLECRQRLAMHAAGLERLLS